MSILVTNKNNSIKIYTSSIVLFLLAVLCIVIDNIYAIFGHGVRSNYMTFMFLYPLCTAIIYLIFNIIIPDYKIGRLGRFGINIFNSGIATLTLGFFLLGILEIAGSSSDYVIFFLIVGWMLAIIGIFSLIVSGITKKFFNKKKKLEI